MSAHCPGCDTVAKPFGIGTAINVLKKGFKLDKQGVISSDITGIVDEATAFVIVCY